MIDIFSKEKRSAVMARIKSEDTTPEKKVRCVLFSEGYRFRLHQKNLPGKPDIVLKKHMAVIFVNGCFWHGHACRIGSGERKPKSNAKYWNDKLAKNISRDRANKKILRKKGWNVITIWECQTRDTNRMSSLLNAKLSKRKIL